LPQIALISAAGAMSKSVCSINFSANGCGCALNIQRRAKNKLSQQSPYEPACLLEISSGMITLSILRVLTSSSRLC